MREERHEKEARGVEMEKEGKNKEGRENGRIDQKKGGKERSRGGNKEEEEKKREG